ncbi:MULTISPECIES: acyltransferase [unclassified Microbulbifer]|uniref:acyltransferase family protein n=1 Tax=unclassified Microbulbifer TaxID=2619833 RepID=UPI0027E4CEE6|nr:MULTISPECIES: acyltransferase [unclassified Microbulbifer]
MNNRFLNLDALRGIAALLVVWQHSSESFVRNPGIAQHGTILADMASAVDFGRIGVICFFLTSGFVIPYSLSGTDATIKKFAVRRFFRLYPVYWLSLIMAVAASVALAEYRFSGSVIAANTTMMQGLFGFQNIQGLYWTLTVELIFYFLCALAFALNILHRCLPLLLLCWGSLFFFVAWQLAGKLAPQITDLPPTITYIPYCLAVMFCRALIRYCYTKKSGYRHALLGVLGVFSLPLCVLLLGVMEINVVESPFRFGLSHLIALAAFFGVLLLPIRPPVFLLLLGAISYSIYLFHPIAMRLVDWSIKQSWGQVFAALPLSFYILATSLLAITMAWILYQLVERPSIAAGRTLTRPGTASGIQSQSRPVAN